MLIRPKRIYIFFLFHALLCDIATCLATLLYPFTHIWTNLLTQCTQCQFLSVDVFSCSDFSPISNARKISVQEASGSTEGEPEVGHPLPDGQVAWTHPWPFH